MIRFVLYGIRALKTKWRMTKWKRIRMKTHLYHELAKIDRNSWDESITNLGIIHEALLRLSFLFVQPVADVFLLS